MRRISIFFIVMMLCTLGMAQDQTYLLFEFMRVDESQGNAYWDTETFWSKIHQQRVNNGDLVGWDLWQLGPGGEDQGYQYVTVQVYNDPVKMMSGGGWDQLMANAKKAYPKMTEADIEKKINSSSDTRDLAVRYYLQEISSTDGDFDMPVGTIAQFDMMKVSMNQWGTYVTAENEVFKPNHQKMVDAGAKGSWSLARVMSPIGSDTYASHMTFNMFNNWKHYFDSWNFDGGETTPEMQAKMQAGMQTRDMKYVYLAELVMKVRKN